MKLGRRYTIRRGRAIVLRSINRSLCLATSTIGLRASSNNSRQDLLFRERLCLTTLGRATTVAYVVRNTLLSFPAGRRLESLLRTDFLFVRHIHNIAYRRGLQYCTIRGRWKGEPPFPGYRSA